MALDFSGIFKKYEMIVAEADKAFQAVKAQTGDMVRCKEGCADCCHALFDLTLVEAAYINHFFNKKFKGMARSRILERADVADRAVYKIKKEMFKASKNGTSTEDIFKLAAKSRVRCPLLSDENLCELYECRPATCRIYGVPTAMGHGAHTCHYSGFTPGGRYPTVFLDRIQDKLYALSHEMASDIGSRYRELSTVLVPLSMALMNDYDEQYLGVEKKQAKGKGKAEPKPLKPLAGTECTTCSQDASACATCKTSSVVLGGHERKPAAKKAAAKTPVKKAAAKPAVKKAAAKAPAKKAETKKASAFKAGPTAKASAKKPVAKKPAVKKAAPAKKAPAAKKAAPAKKKVKG